MAPPRPGRLLVRRGGVLYFEGVDLEELVRARQGRPARIASHAALVADLARAVRDGAWLPLAAAESPEVLALAAAAGAGAVVTSRHELALARAAGFPPERLAACAPVAEDGFLLDAIEAGLARFVPGAPEDAAAAARIAAGLGLRNPSESLPPARVRAPLARRAGGTLACVLRGSPALAVDAVLDPFGRGRAEVLAVRGDSDDVAPPPASRLDGTLADLSGAAPRRARLPASLRRGDWVFVREVAPLALRQPHPGHALPPGLLVRGEHARPLSPRPWPAPGE